MAPLSQNEERLLQEFRSLPITSNLIIADINEPGDPLNLCLTFTNAETREILPYQLVKFYHTSSVGNYEPTDPTDESTARLNGTSRTNTNGRIFISTILPGDYGSSANNRHIHTTVFGASPEGYDIHFKQYSGIMGRNFISNSDQHFLVNLKKDANGTLVGFITIEVKNPS
ncbi:hypothetical protein [Ascidiimonas aurantiaca]|uniref:hypothetical protein n=1 Tax=Ascidiimonas aurantiaca TaxID=1685432 RepID=UPI0030EDBEB0